MNYNPEIYIEDTIIAHLRGFTEGNTSVKDTPWDMMRISLNYCIQHGSSYMSILHKLMQPYYDLYFYGDAKICKNIPGPEHCFMEEVTARDSEFCLWASNQDLIAAAEGWGDYMKRANNDHVHYFFELLDCLINDSYHQDWNKMSDTLKELLFQAEVYSDYKTDELFCILHALTMIMQKEWTLQKKNEVFVMLRGHWGFMKHVYSLMIRHIVGCKLTNFAAVTNNVMLSNSNLPHIDIYYCALEERMNSLGLDAKKYKKLDDARLKLLEKINRREPSETLYELCDTLFPEEFQKMLKHRPKSYGELKEENKQKDLLLSQLESQTLKLEEQLRELTETYKSAIEASIPVNYILERLLKLPIATAWDIYSNLDRLLKTHPAWRNYDIIIHEALEDRENEESGKKKDFYENVGELASRTVSMTNIEHFHNQNGTFNDNSGATIQTMPFPVNQNNQKRIEE